MSRSCLFPGTLCASWVGPMENQTKAVKFGCNRILLISAETVKSESHYFTVQTEVRETTMESMLKKIYDITLLNLITLLC